MTFLCCRSAGADAAHFFLIFIGWVSGSLGRCGEGDPDDSPLTGLAGEADVAVVILHGVLHDGEAQPRAAGGLGVALIHPVEPLEHPALVLRGDADAGIRHRDGGGAVLRGHLHLYGAVGDVILDGVVAEVEDHLIQQPPHADDRGACFLLENLVH